VKPAGRTPQNPPDPVTGGRTLHWPNLYDWFTGLLFFGREDAIREMTVKLANVKPGDRILDAGCGTGSLAIRLKQRFGPDIEVIGLDASPEMIGMAEFKAEEAGLAIPFRVGLMEDLPFPDRYFDRVIASLVLHHLPKDIKQQAFTEIARVLKAGGTFLAVDFEPPENRVLNRLWIRIGGAEVMSPPIRELGGMMEDAGFVDVAAERTEFRRISYITGTLRQY
jgi:ubiquinone/menaquinone biosynthesis C-methylase UbiE